MTSVPLWRRATAELLGTGLLVAVVVGSGIAAQRLSPDEAACVWWRVLLGGHGCGRLVCVIVVHGFVFDGWNVTAS